MHIRFDAGLKSCGSHGHSPPGAIVRKIAESLSRKLKMQGDVFDASQSLFAPVDQNNVVKLRAGSLDPRGFRSDGTTLRYVTVIRYQKGFGGPPSASPWVEWVRQRGGWWSNPLK
ncbi:hypothetical protein, partial [Burkholderia cenocepacia]|uniref:hypothetical protein n=1 Tax=Burkholderia cenocepacia TaxID=95486 RepID=UPI001F232C17